MLNKNKSKKLSSIVVKSMDFTDDHPVLSNFRAVSNTNQLLIDFDLVYEGDIRLVLSSEYTPIELASFRKQVSLDVTIQIKEVVSVMRVCIQSYSSGKPWFDN